MYIAYSISLARNSALIFEGSRLLARFILEKAVIQVDEIIRHFLTGKTETA